MDKIEGLFSIMIDAPTKDPVLVGQGSNYQIALDLWHELVEHHAKFNPEYKVRLIKFSFLD